MGSIARRRLTRSDGIFDDVPPSFVAAIGWVESGWNRSAILPATEGRTGSNLRLVKENIICMVITIIQSVFVMFMHVHTVWVAKGGEDRRFDTRWRLFLGSSLVAL